MATRRLLSTAFVVLGVLVFVSGAVPASASETEAQLLARIQRESKPVKKSLLEMRLAQLELKKAIRAYNKGDVEQDVQLLAVFQGRFNDSWRT